jgi:hypothetical protein
MRGQIFPAWMPGFRGQRVSTQSSVLVEQHLSAILELRRARADLFGADLFADPGWDILLQLFAAWLNGRALNLDDLETVCPRTTVARWAAVLERKGLVTCNLDCADPRDFSLEISADAAAKMASLLRDFRRRLAAA